MKYIIGSGWYSSDIDKRKIKNGDDIIRSVSFSNLWYETILKFSSPEKILIVDSNSPNSCPIEDKDIVEYVKLIKNAGHATNLFGDKYCGWSRSVLLSLMYARMCDIDYFVYLEQDALIYGKDIIENIVNSRKGFDYIFDCSNDFPQPLQQSFFIISRHKMDEFMARYIAIPFDDSQISCEVKFALITSKFFNFLPLRLFVKPERKSFLSSLIVRTQVTLAKFFSCYHKMPINGGRDRPIDFNDSSYYFQHGSEKEVNDHIKRIQ